MCFTTLIHEEIFVNLEIRLWLIFLINIEFFEWMDISFRYERLFSFQYVNIEEVWWFKILDIYKVTQKSVKVFLLLLVTQSCPTLCDPMDCSPPGSSFHGILQARILEWVPLSFSRGSSQLWDWTQVSSIAGRFVIIWPTKEAQVSRIFKAELYVKLWSEGSSLQMEVFLLYLPLYKHVFWEHEHA